MEKPRQQMDRFIDWMLGQLGHVAMPMLDTAAATYNTAGKVDLVRHARRSIATTDDREAVLPWLSARNSEPLTNVWVRPAAALEAHPLVMLDDLPIPLALAVCRKYGGAAVQTSAASRDKPALAQAWIVLTRPLDREARQTVAEALCRLIGSDPDAVSEPRWGRLPGFRQRKPCKEGWTNLLTISDGPALDPEPYLAGRPPLPKATSLPPTGAGGPLPVPPSATGRDESKAEFLFALCSLRAGVSLEETAARVSARALARGKRRTPAQADRYGLKTATAAAACLR